MVERMSRTLEAQLSLFTEDHQRDWDWHLPVVMMSLRSAAQHMMGRELRLPIDLLYGCPESEIAPMLYLSRGSKSHYIVSMISSESPVIK